MLKKNSAQTNQIVFQPPQHEKWYYFAETVPGRDLLLAYQFMHGSAAGTQRFEKR